MRLLAITGSLAILFGSSAFARDYDNPKPSKQYYTSVDGSKVHRPTRNVTAAFGPITASCRDGTYSYSHHTEGTCSGHRGVAQWHSVPR